MAFLCYKQPERASFSCSFPLFKSQLCAAPHSFAIVWHEKFWFAWFEKFQWHCFWTWHCGNLKARSKWLKPSKPPRTECFASPPKSFVGWVFCDPGTIFPLSTILDGCEDHLMPFLWCKSTHLMTPAGNNTLGGNWWHKWRLLQNSQMSLGHFHWSVPLEEFICWQLSIFQTFVVKFDVAKPITSFILFSKRMNLSQCMLMNFSWPSLWWQNHALTWTWKTDGKTGLKGWDDHKWNHMQCQTSSFEIFINLSHSFDNHTQTIRTWFIFPSASKCQSVMWHLPIFGVLAVFALFQSVCLSHIPFRVNQDIPWCGNDDLNICDNQQWQKTVVQHEPHVGDEEVQEILKVTHMTWPCVFQSVMKQNVQNVDNLTTIECCHWPIQWVHNSKSLPLIPWLHLKGSFQISFVLQWCVSFCMKKCSLIAF